MTAVALVHIGKELPDYLVDCLYQLLLINSHSCKVYVVVDDNLVDNLKTIVSKFNLQQYFKHPQWFDSIVNIIPLSTLQNHVEKSASYTRYIAGMQKFGNVGAFRNGFWISTTSRFFYIWALMDLLDITKLFHIENDIMVYESFNNIYSQVSATQPYTDDIWMVQDSEKRVVPSLLYFPTKDLISDLVTFIACNVSASDVFMNDMDILGMYPSKLQLNIEPNGSLVFDGAAIGQYLGGIDHRNIPNITGQELLMKNYTKASAGFVNETSTFKPNTCVFTRRGVMTDTHKSPIKLYLGCKVNNTQASLIANLHIHSKQLYQFSSTFDIGFSDIITGDRVTSLCDFVICTHEILRYHKNLERFAKDIIIIKDWNNVDTILLNKFFTEHCASSERISIKLFVYTHILSNFTKFVLPYLDKSLSYTLYLHNSDHPFDDSYKQLVDTSYIEHIYAQNIELSKQSRKCSLLPIGIANAMWPHGNIVELYTVMRDTYMFKKEKSIYVNINPSTFAFRQQLLDEIKRTKCWNLSKSKPYADYLRELAQHRFCLCVRGNGIDTHRFWECLYLGVIPVVIDNASTNCKNFLRHTSELGIPYIRITHENVTDICNKHPHSFFSMDKYDELIIKLNSDLLKISNYK